VLGFFVVEA
jgi:hypothetical protein